MVVQIFQGLQEVLGSLQALLFGLSCHQEAIYILQKSQDRVLGSVLTQVMESLIKDGRQVFKSLGQMGPSQLSANPKLWIVPFKGKGLGRQG